MTNLLPDGAADDAHLMRKIVGEAFWGIAYNEERLSLAHKHLAVVRGLLAHTGIKFTDEQAAEQFEGNKDEDTIDNVEDYARFLLGEALYCITHYEKALREDHADLAACKALALRGGYDVPYDEIEAEQRKRLAER